MGCRHKNLVQGDCFTLIHNNRNECASAKEQLNKDKGMQKNTDFFTDWNLSLLQLTNSKHLAIDDRERMVNMLRSNVPVGYFPGEYVLRGPDELVTDIIERAGGLRPEAYPSASELTREGEKISLSFKEIIRRPRSKLNFELVDGDSIDIGAKPNLVVLRGEVNTPGNYQYMPNKRLDKY